MKFFENHTKYIIEGSQQELERVHKALSLLVASGQEGQTQVIEEKFNVIFRKRNEGTQGGLDIDDDNN